MPETLNSGDVGTAYAKWLATVPPTPDKPSEGRDLLASHYTATNPIKDFGTLLAKFLSRVAP
jgi:hypothetical protein